MYIVCQAQTFAKVLESNASEQSEDRSITAMGILNTLETICSVMEQQVEVKYTTGYIFLSYSASHPSMGRH